MFKKNLETPNRKNPKTSTCIGTTNMNNHVAESSGMPSVVDVKGLLQITEVDLHSNDQSERVLALCDSACSHSCVSSRLADKLNAKDTPLKLTVHGINCHQVVNTQTVELKMTPCSIGWLLLLLCNQIICERLSSSWNRCYRRRITGNNVLLFRTNQFL